MRLLIHDTLATAFFVEPLRRGWVSAEIDVSIQERLNAECIGPQEFALAPAPECSLLVESHRILPDVAVVARATAGIAMRTSIRPDEISDAEVVLYDVSGTAGVLARALLWPFFGISTTGWNDERSAGAMVTIVEGALALQEPEIGHAIDLGRAWFVMTGMPVVTHTLLAPVGSTLGDRELIVALLNDCRQRAHEQRKALRQALEAALGIERERLMEFFAQQRYRLDDSDQPALVALIVKGAGGSKYLPLTRLPLVSDPDAADEE